MGWSSVIILALGMGLPLGGFILVTWEVEKISVGNCDGKNLVISRMHGKVELVLIRFIGKNVCMSLKRIFGREKRREKDK